MQAIIFVPIVMFLYFTNNVKGQKVFPVVFKIVTGIDYGRYGWPKGTVAVHVFITCRERYSPLALPGDNKFNVIHIENCTVPKTPLVKQFEQSRTDITKLNDLEFKDTFMDMPYPTDYTSGLSIIALRMWNPTNFHAYPEFYTSIKTLKELTFGNMEVPKLPPSESFRLESLILKNSSMKNWDNCEHLQQLEMEELSKDQIPKEWPVTCSKLKTLRIESMAPEAIQHVIDSMNETTLVNLELLSILKCSLVKLPLHFMLSKRFEFIDFSNNNLDDAAILQFPTLKDLKYLTLSNNSEIYSKSVAQLLPRVPSLQELKLDRIGIRKHITDELRDALIRLTSLEKLYMDRTTYEETFIHKHFERLKFLSIKHEKALDIWHLRLHGLPSTGAQRLEVDLGNIAVQHVSIGQKFLESFEYVNEVNRSWLTNKRYKLTVHLASVGCDCKNDILWRALREFPYFLDMPNLKCSHGGLFQDEPLENLSCRKATVNSCQRKMSRDVNYTTVVDCNNNAKSFRWPRPQGFRKFSAAGNQITSLDKAYLPDTLEWLDLRNNSISRLSSEQSAQLFGNKGRRVLLAGNPIICDCDNQPLLDALHVNQSLVMDYDILTCVENGRLLRLVSVDELCRPRLVIIQATISLFVMLVLIAALLVRHYWTTLRMILYAHGCCLSCLREEDLDQDRPFDAFLSFAHGDDQYVMEHLLPKLEGEPNFYRLCVHYRDWRVGNWIPGQIMQSVRFSKRTIIVLSKKFVESSWGMLEFRHANAGATSDGRQRLLVLVIDDVLSEKLSPEIQGYLELNTYLKCSDPWFWEKLYYAMPHKNHKEYPPRRHFNYATRECMVRNNLCFREEVETTDSRVHAGIIPIVELNDNSIHESIMSIEELNEGVMPVEETSASSVHEGIMPVVESTDSSKHENIIPIIETTDCDVNGAVIPVMEITDSNVGT